MPVCCSITVLLNRSSQGRVALGEVGQSEKGDWDEIAAGAKLVGLMGRSNSRCNSQRTLPPPAHPNTFFASTWHFSAAVPSFLGLGTTLQYQGFAPLIALPAGWPTIGIPSLCSDQAHQSFQNPGLAWVLSQALGCGDSTWICLGFNWVFWLMYQLATHVASQGRDDDKEDTQ